MVLAESSRVSGRIKTARSSGRKRTWARTRYGGTLDPVGEHRTGCARPLDRWWHGSISDRQSSCAAHTVAGSERLTHTISAADSSATHTSGCSTASTHPPRNPTRRLSAPTTRQFHFHVKCN